MANSIDKFYFQETDSSIKNFSSEVLEKIINEYHNIKFSINEIKKKYDVTGQMSLFRQLPYVKCDETCEKCNNPIYIKKERIEKKKLITKKLCLACGHDYTPNCSCTICIDERKKRKRS